MYILTYVYINNDYGVGWGGVLQIFKRIFWAADASAGLAAQKIRLKICGCIRMIINHIISIIIIIIIFIRIYN